MDMEVMWKSIIQDMLDGGMSPDEVKLSLRQRYPDNPDLEGLVGEMLTPRVASFCKKGQDFGFGYGNPGPTNYSVPNSEGDVGTGVGVDPTALSTPSSSYTDRLERLNNMERQEENRKEREKRRKKLLDKLTSKKAAVPGESLTGPSRDRVDPGELLRNMTKDIEDIEKTLDIDQKIHEPPTQQTEERLEQEQKVKKELTPPRPDVGIDLTKTDRQVKDTSENVEKLRKDIEDTTETSKEQAEELGRVTENVDRKVKQLTRSLENLTR